MAENAAGERLRAERYRVVRVSDVFAEVDDVVRKEESDCWSNPDGWLGC